MKKLYLLSILFLSFVPFISKSQNYCTPTFNGTTGYNSNYFTYIESVSFGEIDNYVGTPNILPPYINPYITNTIYTDYSASRSTDVVLGQSYPLKIIVGNGANTQQVAVWIDYNQNKIFETTERVFLTTDYANTGDHILRSNITIPANATKGTTKMRVGTILNTTTFLNPPAPCGNNLEFDCNPPYQATKMTSQHYHDYTVIIVEPAVQSYLFSTTTQPNTKEVVPGSSNNLIIGVEIVTNSDGVLSPLVVDTLFFSSLGTTNPSEIANAKLYYTAKNPEFSALNQIGNTVSSPGTYFNISTTQTLQPGKNYFWLTYDLSSNAIRNNLMDARCNAVYVSARRIPNVTNPFGSRRIGYCIAYGNKSNFIYVRRVVLGDINRFSTYNLNTGYTDYTNNVDTLEKGIYHHLSIEVGNSVNENITQVWIDFDQNGIFDIINERVLFDSIMGITTSNPSYGPVTDSFIVPSNAPTGSTRMRVISHENEISPTNPCKYPIEIGEVEDYTVIIGAPGQPVSKFIASIACFGSPNIFTDQSYTFDTFQINSWIWEFGDGDTSHQQNPQHTYSNPGVYNVKLTVNTNYTGSIFSSLTQSVKVNNPQADFAISTNLYKSVIRFSDETSGGIVTSWYWEFGDLASSWNNIDSRQAPTHIFDTVGTYTVMFVATTEGNCTDTIYKNIFIDSMIAPIVNFGASSYNPYYGQRVNLIDLSVNYPTSWKWLFSPNTVTFHDSTTDITQNPVVSFNNITTYTVTLLISNAVGSDSMSRNIITKDYLAPIADFSANLTTVKSDQLITFLDESQNDPTSWIWTLGDGDSAFVQHPSHSYYYVGNYTISLKATNPKGSDKKTKTQYIKVSNEYELCDPDAPSTRLFSGFIFDSGGKNEDYKPNTTCGFLIKPECAGPINLTFTAFEYNQNDYLRVYDGEDNSGTELFTLNGLTGANLPPKKVAYSGAMYIEEISTNFIPKATGFGAYWSAAPNIKPMVIIKADTLGYKNAPINFVNNTTGYGNTYYWDYDNDNIFDDTIQFQDPDKNGFYSFDSNGFYTIKLVAENCKGRDSAFHTVHIINPTSPPVADFILEDPKDTFALILENIQFKDLSTNGPTIWLWEVNPPGLAYFVNGNNVKNPIIAFFDPGYYDISLTSTNMIGSSTKVTKQKYIYVKEKIIMCQPSSVTGTYETNSPAGRIFDSGGENKNYEDNSNSTSCPGFLIKPCADKVYVHFISINYAAGDYIRIYDGEDNTGKPLFSGNGITGQQDSLLVVGESGSIFIEEVTNASNTEAGFIADWSIKPFSQPKAVFECPDTTYTGGYITFFENTTREYVDKFYWDYNYDGFIDDTTSLNGKFAFSTPGYKNVFLRVTNCAGTSSFVKNIVVINPTQKPESDFTADRLTGDTSDVFTLIDLTKYGPNKWTWNFNPFSVTYIDPTDTVHVRPMIKFNNVGKYDVTLITENTFGSDTAFKSEFIRIFTYCRPTVDTMIKDFGISKVILKDNELSNTTTCGVDEYSDYTSTHSVRLELGGTYGFQIQSIAAVYPYSRKIWIDFNQDGIFNDTTELAAFLYNDQSTSWFDSLEVPSNAEFGQTRMRIGFDYSGYPNKPCGPNYTGEFEDYMIIITPDFTPPTIELIGNQLEFTEIGYPYIDQGATAWDAVDGNISYKIVTTNNVDTAQLGDYQVVYNVSDTSGNVASPAIRKVTVSPDKTPPVITLLGDNPMIVAVFNSYIEPGATAWDNYYGDVTNLIGIESSVDSSRVDTYSVIYSAYDLAPQSNYSTATRTVYVADTSPPVIYLYGQDTAIQDIGITYIDSGAYAVDNYYTDIKISTSSNVDIYTDGWYWVKYDATDPAANAALQMTRTVKVGDPISVNELTNSDNISIYPNPSDAEFTILLKFTHRKDIYIEIVNSLGENVLEFRRDNLKQEKIVVNLDNKPAGIYFVKLHLPDNIITKKVTIVR